jgi:hypothetical protein
MGSFTNLNTYGQEQLELDDNRDPNVVVNISNPVNVSDIQTSHSFTVNRNNLEIQSISQADITQPLYQIDLSAVPGATVTWPTVQAGSITFDDAGVFYYKNVSSVSEWDAVKDATINIPTTVFGDIEYVVRLNWVSQGVQTFEFTVTTTIPFSLLPGTLSMSADISKRINATIALSNFTVIACSGDIV